MLKVVQKTAQVDHAIPLHNRTPNALPEPFWPRVGRALVVLSAAVGLHLWLDTSHIQRGLPPGDAALTVAQAGAPALPAPALLRPPERLTARSVMLKVEEVIAYPTRTIEALAAGAMQLARDNSPVGTIGLAAAAPGPLAGKDGSRADDAASALGTLPAFDLALAGRPGDASAENTLASLVQAVPLQTLARPLTAAEAVLLALPSPVAHVPAATLTGLSTPERIARETQAILGIVDAYSRAYERLDVQAAKAVSPSIDDRALQRAFQQLEGQKLRFESCGVSIDGAAANARCLANASYRPKVGSRVIHLTGRQWTFNFSQSESGWQIVKTTIQ